ncbi:Bug family tripartite tricarboxylate transporter substrate binding protein [Polynucleobacter sinensis]|jgi:tripartite-type tricarboxylate transporter receptor subunit TctC|uniref:Bug family tripartite tricarboxylate transporter substrate binding protein n=1 Tax=Polynucleobacter sinensis TaxID=1743157 RepID=UPI00078335A8|nr:tripartite tricarboxylate transporter substrate binding protein [Polynucleobacter sinensis]
MNSLLRKAFWICALIFLGSTHIVSAQGYPEKAIRLMVGYAPGGLTDGVARTLAPQLSDILGKQVVVENRGGGGSSIATDLVAKSPADGYTLLMADQALISNPSLFSSLPYDTLKDLQPVALVGTAASVIVVNSALPVRDLKALITLAKSKPGTLNYASGGNGTMTHLAGELFKQVARVDIVHVPYKGTGPAVVDLLGGQVPMMFSSIGPVAQYIKSGQLIALAVTGETRSPALPSVPTLSELGLAQATVIGYWGMMAPTGIPGDVAEKLMKAVNDAVKRPDVNQRLVALGIDPSFATGARYEKILSTEIPKWAQVIKFANIRID